MKHLNVDYYVGLLSAGLFYGATHQKPARFQVITNKRVKHPLQFGDVVIQLVYLSLFLAGFRPKHESLYRDLHPGIPNIDLLPRFKFFSLSLFEVSKGTAS